MSDPTRGTPEEMKKVLKYFKSVKVPAVMKSLRPFPTVAADGSPLIPPNFFKVTQYRSPETEPEATLKGNLMALTFPPPLSDSELFADLYKPIPPFYDGFFDQPIEVREGRLWQMNHSSHYPFPMDFEVIRRGHGITREMLKLRDPRQPRVRHAILAIAEGRAPQLPRMADSGGGGGTGMLLSGISGVGKSSSIDRLVHHLGNFGRYHYVLDGEPAQWPQLGVIRVNVGPTWQATQERILREANRQLGADLNPWAERSKNQLESDVPYALSKGLAPVLIIDELNQLNLKSQSAEARRIVRGLNELMTTWGIPVILVGAMSVRQLLLEFPHEMSRYTVGGDMLLDRLMQFDHDTDNFINMLRAHSVSKMLPKYSDNFNRDLWSHCMGVRRLMVEYMRAVLKRHAHDESIRPDKQLLWSIATDEMRCFEDTLSFLRKVLLGMQLSYRDCHIYENYFDAAIQSSPSEAQFRADAKWRAAHPNSKAGDGARLNAQEFENVQADIAREGADATERNSRQPAAAPTKPGKGRKRQDKTPLKKAKEKLRKASGVAPLQGAARGKPEPTEGINAGGIR